MTEDDEQVRARVHVTGRVQGVAYRANTEDTANARGVNGWVRNTDDGRVEAVFEGDPETVEGMIEWCHTGSPRANVEDVTVEYEEPRNADGFHVRWSG
ncbi:MAG: acylphosphatase [Halolamina sp.]